MWTRRFECPDAPYGSGQLLEPFTGDISLADINIISSFIQNEFPEPELFVQSDGSLGCFGNMNYIFKEYAVQIQL